MSVGNKSVGKKFFFVVLWLLAAFSVVAAPMKASGAATQIAMDNPALLYSPFNWNVANGAARTINSGAYFRVLFTGTSCTLQTETSHNAAPYSEFVARVDGGSWQLCTLAAGNPSIPVASNLPNHPHLLEVVVKSTSETLPRWNGSETVVTFTGLSLDAGATVTAPVRRPYAILIYGDSITEGVRTEGTAAPLDTDRNDATHCWSWQLSQLLPAEVGVVGFGATGLNRGGSGGVPSLPETYNLLYAGQPRSFTSPAPDLVIYLEGTNDWLDIKDGMTKVVQAILTAAPHAQQLLLVPFNGSHAAELQAVAARINSPHVVFASTAGWLHAATDTPDSLHPYAFADIANLAPRVAALAFPLLSRTTDRSR